YTRDHRAARRALLRQLFLTIARRHPTTTLFPYTTLFRSDQEMMQKNISVSNLKDSQKNMITFCFILLVANFIFLLLGGLLYLYADAQGITATGDNIFPYIALKSGLPFIITVCFMIGLISALFPSADGALTALTSS